jgi:hypothetical protein
MLMAMNDIDSVEETMIVVNATLRSKSEEAQGWKLVWDIPSFNSNYDTDTNRISPDLASRFTVGNPYTIELVRQNLKRNKDGSYKDGTRQYDYYWGILGLSAPGTQPSPTPEPPVSSSEEVKRRSIERQTALIQATLLGAAHVSAGNAQFKASDIIEVADAFHAWIEAQREG